MWTAPRGEIKLSVVITQRDKRRKEGETTATSTVTTAAVSHPSHEGRTMGARRLVYSHVAVSASPLLSMASQISISSNAREELETREEQQEREVSTRTASPLSG